MSVEKKKSKRKNLLRYLILAACILLIAAITVITVCAVNDWFQPQLTVDTGTKPVNPVDPDDPDKPTDTTVTAANPVSNLDVTRDYEFGLDVSLSNSYRFHQAMDMAAKVGDNVVASLDGTVENITVGNRTKGTEITIVHEGGIKTRYRFINVKEGLKKGDKVKRGDVIGTVAEPNGNEFKQDPHLHFEVEKNGKLIDPAEFLEIADK